MPSSKYSITDFNDRLFTAKEIADMGGVHLTSVHMYAKKLSLPMIQEKGSKRKLFSYPSMKAILLALSKTSVVRGKKSKNGDKGITLETLDRTLASLELKEKEEAVRKKPDIETLRKQHPYVTDDRCFDINWWPSPLPDSFYED